MGKRLDRNVETMTKIDFSAMRIDEIDELLPLKIRVYDNPAFIIEEYDGSNILPAMTKQRFYETKFEELPTEFVIRANRAPKWKVSKI